MWWAACEQIWTMAKDKIYLDYDECYTSDSNHNSDEPESSDEDQDVVIIWYLDIIYRLAQIGKTHVFSMEDQNENIMMGGILSLNREDTSFIQQFHIK